MSRVPDQYKRNPDYGRAMAWGPLYRRHFPIHTDPFSRHVKVIAEDILRNPYSPVRRMLIDAGYEPDHWARSMEITIRALWREREKMSESEQSDG